MGESFAENHKYREAISQEFFEAETSDDPNVLLKKVNKVLLPTLSDLTENLIRIARFGESDASQLSATKTIFSLLGIIKTGRPDTKANELTDLFKELANNPVEPID